MRKVVSFVLACSLLIAGCAGRQANPVPAYLPGDENRSCKGYQAEMAQLNADMQRIMPETNKFAYNAVCVAGGLFLIFPFFFMDLKDAEKTEWEAMRVRYNRLLVYAAEKGCDFSGTGLPDSPILSPKEAKELAKKRKQAAEAKGVPEAAPTEGQDQASSYLATCANCGQSIGKLEPRFTYQGHTVCGRCYKRLKGAE